MSLKTLRSVFPSFVTEIPLSSRIYLKKIAALAEELGHIEPVTTVTQTTSAPQGFVWPSIQDMQERGFVLKEFLETIEDKLLLEALGMTDGVKNQAAEVLGIKRTTLIEKIKKRGLE